MASRTVPAIRIRSCNDSAVRSDGRYVLYWMTAFHRTSSNFALQRAVEWCRTLGKPLLVLDVLSCGDPWAGDRLHRFALDGMAELAHRLARSAARYYPHVETEPDAGVGLIAALAQQACVVVTDDFPTRFTEQTAAAASRASPVLVEKVDANGLLPMRAAPRAYPTAFAFRRFLQKELRAHLAEPPKADPLKGARLAPPPRLPAAITKRWPTASRALLTAQPAALSALPISHSAAPVPVRGGMAPARAALKRFVTTRLDSYAALRNHPDDDATSNLSPYLHFGHISPHEVFDAVMAHAGWSPRRLAARATGGRSGWWRAGENADAFLDQLVTWRELGYNMSSRRADHDAYDAYDGYDSLPEWARRTLAKHAKDKRPYRYSLDELAAARTHDALWNAAQTQLVREGRIVNYLRMLWGKKILEWTAAPEEALATMIELNNRYALDGRNPNSYSGIFWILGRYDRPWGPERPIFGTVRYMSSENTARKLRCRRYMEKYHAR